MTHIGTHTPAHGMHEYRGVDNSMGIYELMLNYKLKLYDLARKFSSTYIIDVDLALESTGKWPEGKSPMIRPYETLGGHPESLGAQVLAEYFHHQLLITSKNSRRVKCVVLDCDNTLWKGIIREDGIDGIKIFRTRLQRLWQLSQRGMMMALCSKNDPEDEELIMEALRSYGKFHESIVATRINWTHKSANIRSIAEELNIGLDSLAFFDDNPFERSEVETVLPEVMVYEELEIEQAPDWYNFHPVGDLSKDSADRAQKYKEESVRKEEQQDFGEDNFEDFLVSCGLRIELRSATPAELPRVAELLQRTNQMNATLQRSDLADIRSKYDSGSGFVHIAKLGDKFGDYGLIGVIISELKDKELSIQELAFSCRAMGRRVEHALIEEVIGYASDNKLDKLSINVTKTSRNHQIIKTLDEEGFVEEVVDGDLVTMSTKIKGRKGREIPHWFTISTDIGGDE